MRRLARSAGKFVAHAQPSVKKLMIAWFDSLRVRERDGAASPVPERGSVALTGSMKEEEVVESQQVVVHLNHPQRYLSVTWKGAKVLS